MGLLVLAIIVVVALGGVYVYTHQGQSTTVHNPKVGVNPTHGLDQLLTFLATPRGGVVMGCLLIAVLGVTVWQKIPKGTLVILAIVVAFVVIGLLHK